MLVSEARVPELQRNDVLLQLNSHRLRDCDDLARALEEARANGLDLLLLVERQGGAQAVRVDLPAQTSIVAAAPATAGAATVPVQARTDTAVVSPTNTPTAPVSPTAAAPTAVPTPLSSADAALVREAIAEANRFGRELRDSLPLLSSQPWLGRVQHLLDEQTRRRAQSQAVAAAEPVFAYYRTVGEILAYTEEATREANRERSRGELVLEYDSESTEVNGWLKRYPFLAESVIEPPQEVTFIARGERPGRWRPNHAIELLVQRALSEARHP